MKPLLIISGLKLDMNMPLPSKPNNYFSEWVDFYLPSLGWLIISLLLLFSVLFN